MISCPWFSWCGWHSRDLGALLSEEAQLGRPSRPSSSCLASVGTLVVILSTFVFFSHRGLFLFSQKLRP